MKIYTGNVRSCSTFFPPSGPVDVSSRGVDYKLHPADGNLGIVELSTLHPPPVLWEPVLA